MKFSGQSGMTLIELVIALSIAAVVMAALSSVVFGANLVSRTWGHRTYLAETAQLLPNRLQADAHRYVPCGSPAPGELDLCLPGRTDVVVSYAATGGCPCDLLRNDLALGSSTVVVRSLAAPPSFETNCATAGGVDVGTISARVAFAGDATPQPPVVVFFRAPVGSCT